MNYRDCVASWVLERVARLQAAGLPVAEYRTREGTWFIRLPYLADEALDAPKVAAAGFILKGVTFWQPPTGQLDTLMLHDPCPYVPTEAELREQREAFDRAAELINVSL